MSIEDWLPSLGERFFSPVDEDFEEVYEAYEEFYKAANTPNGRGGRKSSAAEKFVEEVSSYYEIDQKEGEAGVGWGLFLGEPGQETLPMEEKMSEEELYRYLKGEL